MTSMADHVARRLRAHGVDIAFGIPGTHNLELFKALNACGIRIIAAHHEQGLGYAADAWSRVSGRPAVVITTTGPGITNLITALATSLAASVPVLAIAPGVPEAVHGRGAGWLHDLPSQVATLATTVRSARADSTAQAVAFIDDVFNDWRTRRRVPAYLELPVDLLEAPADADEAEMKHVREAIDAFEATAPPATGSADGFTPLEGLAAAAATLADARRPAIVVGRGGCGPNAAGALRELAELLRAPVLTTANGKGALDENHPLSLGLALRLDGGRAVLRDADTVLVIGTDLGQSEFWGPCPLLSEQTIRIDIDEAGLEATLRPHRMLLGDAEFVVPALLDATRNVREASSVAPVLPSWAAAHAPAIRTQIEREGGVYRAYHEIMLGMLEGDVAITGDSSQATYLGSAYFFPLGRPNRFLYPAGYGTLGYAVPAAIGASLAGVADRVVAITGEGGLMFSVQEIATASRLGLSIPIVVFSNGGFQEIREGMATRGIPPVGVDFVAPDFTLVARAFGADGEQVAGPAKFGAAFGRALAAPGPYVLDVRLPTGRSAVQGQMS